MTCAYLIPGCTTDPVEIEIKRSRFIGYLAYADNEDDARDFISTIRSSHRDARHVCHAFTCSPRQTIQRSSDDGEPAGTAGMPILKALVARRHGSFHISDTVLTVVRYFGGIKLGAGGLVQAYSETAVATLDATPFKLRKHMALLSIYADYQMAARLETILRSHYQVADVIYHADRVEIIVCIDDSDESIADARQQIAQLSAGQAYVECKNSCWVDSPLPS